MMVVRGLNTAEVPSIIYYNNSFFLVVNNFLICTKEIEYFSIGSKNTYKIYEMYLIYYYHLSILGFS